MSGTNSPSPTPDRLGGRAIPTFGREDSAGAGDGAETDADAFARQLFSVQASDAIARTYASSRQASQPPGHAPVARASSCTLKETASQLRDARAERERLLREADGLVQARVQLVGELRELDRTAAVLHAQRSELESRLEALASSELAVKAMLTALDGRARLLQQQQQLAQHRLGGAALDEFAPRADSSVRTLRGHRDVVLAVHYDPAMGCISSGGTDGVVRVWGTSGGEAVSGTGELGSHGGWVHAVCSDDRFVVSGGGDRMVRVWDAASRVQRHSLAGHRGSVTCVQNSGSTVLSGSMDATVRLWEAETGECLATLTGHSAVVTSLQFWQYGLATASGDASVRLWDIRSGRCHRLLTGHRGMVSAVRFDETELVSLGVDGVVRVCDLRMGSCRGSMSPLAPAQALALTANLIATAVGSGLHLYSRSDLSLAAVLEGHAGTVKTLAAADDVLVSGAVDATVKTWLVADL